MAAEERERVNGAYYQLRNSNYNNNYHHHHNYNNE